jgi:cyanophycin synthetase
MEMEFRKVRALRGPNIWASFPVLEAWVDLGTLKDSSSDELPGFNDRLMAWVPSMIEHRCSVGKRGGFFERLRRGTYQAHILEHVALELQCLADTEVGFGRTRETSEEGVYKVAIEYEQEDLARASLESARELCLAAVYDRRYDVEAEVRKLRELASRVCPDAGTVAIIRAAQKRKIPVRALNNDGLLQLGHGARQRRIRAPQTDRSSALAESIARDIELTRNLLEGAGVPVPADAASAEAGVPDGDTTPSKQWRLLVVGGRVVAAARHPAQETDACGLDRDVTDRLHSEVIARAVEAAKIIGLDVAGIDIVAGDVSRPLEAQGGVVTAVDPRPDLRLHLRSSTRGARPVGEAIVAQLFPEGQTGRIPVAGITGVNGKTTTTRLLAHIVARMQRCVGMTCTEGIYIGGRRIEAGDCSGPLSARAVLQNPKVEFAILETARGGILRAGLGFDYCDVAVVTNIADGDHLGISDIDTPEQLARVKRTLVESVAPAGVAVLKADDPLVAAMAPHCPGSIVYFARDGSHPLILRHRGDKGRVAFVRDGHIVLADGDQEIRLIHLQHVPLTHSGRIGFQIENALAAAAAAWNLGVPCEAIRVGLESFTGTIDETPSRFNLLEFNGATVIMDYGHNVASLSCLIQAIDQLPHEWRSVVYSAAGDRRDCDLIRQGELLGDAFDHVYLYEEEQCIRGRKDGEIAALMRSGLAGRRRTREVEEVKGAVHAVEVALRSACPGELLLVQVDRVEETVELVKRYLTAGVMAREIDFADAISLGQAGVRAATHATNPPHQWNDGLCALQPARQP